jgi:hypothetical protein
MSSSLFRRLERGKPNVPSDAALSDTALEFPLVVVVDEANSLLPYLMILNSERILYNTCFEISSGQSSKNWVYLWDHEQ